MTPVLFINCSAAPYIALILRRSKIYETRTRDTLRRLVGLRVLLAETGRSGRPIIKGSAIIGAPLEITDADTWNQYRKLTRVPLESIHDWKDTTRRKYLYPLIDVRPLDPFPAPEGIRHGRVWMEYAGPAPLPADPVTLAQTISGSAE